MYRIIKRLLDIIFSFIFLIILLPFIIIIALILILKYKKIIDIEEIIGKDFQMYKLYNFNSINNYKLKKIPQLWNILKGDMSFVGPKPLSKDYVKYCTEYQKNRFLIRPGLISYSQITDDDNILDIIDRDMYYINNCSLIFDFIILLHSIFINTNRINSFDKDILQLKNQKKKIKQNYSVLLPVCNKDDPKWLRQAIVSVLDQTYKTNDFVIISDGIVNKSLKKVIFDYKEVRFVESNKQGLTKTLNEGLKIVKNNLVARIDADDYWKEDKIEKQLLYLENHKDVVLIGTNMQEFCDDKLLRKTSMPIFYKQIVKYSKYRSPFRHSSVIYRKDIVVEVGSYPNIQYFEDYALWLKVIEKYKVHNLDECLTFFRVNNNLYKRRGGLKYLKAMVFFEKEQFKQKKINIFNYIIVVFFHSIVCLVPNGVRKIIYNGLLRKK